MSNFPRGFSSELILDILAQANTATAIHSTDEMVIETANDAMIAIWGKDKGVIGKPIEEALPELKGQPFLGLLQNVLHTGITKAGTDTRADLVVNGKLQPFYFDFEYRAVMNSAGEVICVLHTATDVTDRYYARERERQLEAELQAANEELAASNEELAASNEELAATNEELASTNEELIATNEDLGQSQQSLIMTNNSLAESESRFRSILRQAPVGICLIRASDLLIQEANDSYLKLVGRERGNMENRTILQAVPEAGAYVALINNVIETGVPYVANEHRLMVKRGGTEEAVFINLIYEPLKDAEGEVYAVMAIITDVTEQVTSRQRIEQSKNRLDSMVMTAPIGMTVLQGRDLVIEIANKPMYDLWNRNAEQALGNKLLDVFPELNGQPFPRLLQQVFETGHRIAISESVVEVAGPGGNLTYIVDFAYDPLFGLDGKVEAILATVIDITEQVNARDELQKARDLMRQAIDSAAMGTWNADVLTDRLTVSEQGKRLHGIPNGTELNLSESLKLISPAHVERVRAMINEAIGSNKSFDVEYLVNPMDDSKPRWLRSTGKAYYDGDRPVSISGTMIDITESKVYDQQKDDFISIASHELKTPVTSLKAALQLLDRMKDKPSPQMLHKLIEQSNRSMDKISNLIEDLLNLSRMNEGQLKLKKSRFTIADMLAQCCNHVRAAGRHELVVQGEMELQVVADEDRVDQVLVNMVNNAAKYASNSIQIFLIVEKLGNMAKISVKDTGPGIPRDKQARLFERYYRTDAAGYQNSGLGLGLYISAEIIRKHGGEIGVESEVGEGSTFWFTLPLPV